jgi:hypothetical protein
MTATIRPWTTNDLVRLADMRQAGIPCRQIAAALGRTVAATKIRMHTVRQTMKELGLAPDDWPGLVTHLTAKEEAKREVAIAATEGSTTDTPVVEDVPTRSTSQVHDLSQSTVDDDRLWSQNNLLFSEAREAKRKYKQLLEQQALEDRIINIFRERIPVFAATPPMPVPLVSPLATGKPEALVVLVGDTHVGQVVSPSQTNQFGTYCPRVYCERLYYLQEEVLGILASARVPVDELHVFFLGDIVHGMLDHGAEAEENLVAADQFTLATWTLTQFLLAIAMHVPSVQVHCVCGNHGRWPDQRRMPTKNRYSNLDYLVYSAMRHSLTLYGLQNLTFNLNQSPRQIVSIKGSSFMASHGDHLRGGDKQLAIPIHSIAREINATSQRHAASDLPPVDYYICGDKHKAVSLPLARGEYLINGTLVGVDEFSMGFPPSEPQQLVFQVHPERRKTWSYAVKVAQARALPTCPYQIPSEIKYLLEDDVSAMAA